MTYQYTIMVEDGNKEYQPIQRYFESLEDAEIVKRAYLNKGKNAIIFYRRITDWEVW